MGTQASCNVGGCARVAAFRFGPGVLDNGTSCLWHALTYRPVFGRAVTVVVIVGTILVVINQADVLLDGYVSGHVLAKIGLTYLVPYLVSTYSALAANRLGGT